MTDKTTDELSDGVTGSVDMAPRRRPPGTWHVGPRRIPLPAAASDELRASIAATPQPDTTTAPGLPDDEVALRALVAEADAAAAERARALREQIGTSVVAGEVGGVGVFHIEPAEVDPRHEDHLFVYVHGGAFVLNAGEAGTAEAVVIAHRLGIRALSIDYRMAPDHPLPAGPDDVMSVWREVVDDRPSASVALGGSSGGGNLCTILVQQAVAAGVDVPGALYLGTPGTDLTDKGDSWHINHGIDRLLVSYDDVVNAARLHAAGRDLADPMVSPVNGSFEGFPPTILVTGTRDLLLSATAQTHTKIRQAGSIADLLVLEGASHGDYMIPLDTPESRFTYAQINQFFLTHLC